MAQVNLKAFEDLALGFKNGKTTMQLQASKEDIDNIYRWIMEGGLHPIENKLRELQQLYEEVMSKNCDMTFGYLSLIILKYAYYTPGDFQLGDIDEVRALLNG